MRTTLTGFLGLMTAALSVPAHAAEGRLGAVMSADTLRVCI